MKNILILITTVSVAIVVGWYLVTEKDSTSNIGAVL